MRWKTTLALLLATVGIGAYISLYEMKQPTPSERRREAKHVLDIDPAAVSEIRLDLPGAKCTLTRAGDAWTMQPGSLRGNGALVAQLLNHTSPLRAERVLTGTPDKPLDLKSFGLEPPSSTVTLTVKGRPVTLLIGEKAAVGGNRYMKDADRPAVFLVPEAIFTIINQPLEYYRDHHVVQLGGHTAQSLAVTSASSTFTLTRDGAAWRLTAPFEDAADRKAADSLLNDVAALQITRFVHDAPDAAQLAAAGLEKKPFAEIAVAYGDPERQVTLSFGSALPDDPTLIHAKRSDEPALYGVAKESVEALLVPPDDLRSKQVFHFFTGNVTKVSVKRGGHDWTIERVNTQWQDASGKPMDSVRVEMWLAQLADARFERLVPAGIAVRAADAPREWVSVWTSDTPEPQRLVLDAAADMAVGGIYGLIEPRNLRVVLPERFNDLLALPDERAGAEHPLDDRAVDQQVQRDQDPPEQVPPQGVPGQQPGR